MSKFISVALESRGIIDLPSAEVVAGEIRATHYFEQEHADRIIEKFALGERNLLRSFNMLETCKQSSNIRHKLYRYAK